MSLSMWLVKFGYTTFFPVTFITIMKINTYLKEKKIIDNSGWKSKYKMATR